MTTEVLKVGVLLVGGGVQLLDLAAVDVLGSCDPGYLKAAGLPDALLSKASGRSSFQSPTSRDTVYCREWSRIECTLD